MKHPVEDNVGDIGELRRELGGKLDPRHRLPDDAMVSGLLAGTFGFDAAQSVGRLQVVDRASSVDPRRCVRHFENSQRYVRCCGRVEQNLKGGGAAHEALALGLNALLPAVKPSSGVCDVSPCT